MNYNKYKFLIVRFSSMGDVLLTSALIRCIKSHYPDSIIDFVVDKQFLEIIENNPYINDIIIYDKKKSIKDNETLKLNISNDYTIIDLQNNFRSKKFSKGIGNQYFIMHKNHFLKWFLVHFKKKLFDTVPIPEQYIRTVNKLGIQSDNKGLEIWLPEEKKSKNYIKKTDNTQFITKKRCIFGVAPGAKHKTKQWLPEYFAELIILLNTKYEADFFLLGGKEDEIICKKVYEIVHSNEQKVCSNKQPNGCVESNITNIYDKSGQTSILETVQILDQCDILITNDTGVMHLGAARHLPIVAIFGSTTPNFGFAPYGVPNKICEIDLKCRPCTHIGKAKCPKNHFNCMKMISPTIVMNNVNELIYSNKISSKNKFLKV